MQKMQYKIAQANTSSAKPALPAQWVSEVFEKLRASYGYPWESRHGNDGNAWRVTRAEWSEKLVGLTYEQIQHALRNMEELYTQYPPTLGQFRQLAREHKVKSSANTVYDQLQRRDREETEQLTSIAKATQAGWGFKGLPPEETFKRYRLGELPYRDVVADGSYSAAMKSHLAVACELIKKSPVMKRSLLGDLL